MMRGFHRLLASRIHPSSRSPYQSILHTSMRFCIRDHLRATVMIGGDGGRARRPSCQRGSRGGPCFRADTFQDTGPVLPQNSDAGERREGPMEIDPRTADRLPFHDPDEAEQAYSGAAELSSDGQLRHLQRVPLFSGFSEDELRRVAELSRIIEPPAGTVITQIGRRGGLVLHHHRRYGGSADTAGRLFWRDEPGRWRAPIRDDRGDDGFAGARRGSFPFLAASGRDSGADEADPHDFVASRATPRADDTRDTPGPESDLTLRTCRTASAAIYSIFATAARESNVISAGSGMYPRSGLYDWPEDRPHVTNRLSAALFWWSG